MLLAIMLRAIDLIKQKLLKISHSIPRAKSVLRHGYNSLWRQMTNIQNRCNEFFKIFLILVDRQQSHGILKT
jgi:hypothetical protein